MVHPERPPLPGMPNNYSWPTPNPSSVNHGWGYVPRYPAPAGYSSAWSGMVPPGNVYPPGPNIPPPDPNVPPPGPNILPPGPNLPPPGPNILTPGPNLPPPGPNIPGSNGPPENELSNSWPFPPPPASNGTGPVLPGNLPFCPPPPPPVDGQTVPFPYPSLPATAGSLPPFGAPPPTAAMSQFATSLPMISASTLPNMPSGGYPVLNTNSSPQLHTPSNEAKVSSKQSGSSNPEAAECVIQDSQSIMTSAPDRKESVLTDSKHSKRKDNSKHDKHEESDQPKDPRDRIKEQILNSSRKFEKRTKESQSSRNSRERYSRDSCDKSSRSRTRDSDSRSGRSSLHSRHRSRSPRSPGRRRSSKDRRYDYDSRSSRRGSRSPKHSRYSKDRERRSKTPRVHHRETDKRSRFSDSRKSNWTSSRSRSKSPSRRKETHGNRRDSEIRHSECRQTPRESEKAEKPSCNSAIGTKDSSNVKETEAPESHRSLYEEVLEKPSLLSNSKEDVDENRAAVSDPKIVSPNSDPNICDTDQSQRTDVPKNEKPQKKVKSPVKFSLKKSSPKKKILQSSRVLKDSKVTKDKLSNLKTKSTKEKRHFDVNRLDKERPDRRDSRSRSVSSKTSSYSYKGQDGKSLRERNRRRSRERNEVLEDQPALSTEASKWIICTPAETFYREAEEGSKEVVGTDALKELHEKFQYELLERAERARATKPKYDPPVRKTKLRKHKPPEAHSDDDSSSSNKETSSDEEDTALEELEKKRQHPDRLHPELWFNDPKEMNDGPLCRCSAKARRSGIRHGIYVGENHLPPCDPLSNNAKRLHHYKIAMTPVTNFLTKCPTVIVHEGQKYIFEGFSMLAHKPLPKLPNCKVIRFNYEYTILYIEEKMPPNFTVGGIELFSKFLLEEVLELGDLDWKAYNDPDGCPKFHFLPRFAKVSEGEGKELLSLNVVLEYLLKANHLLIEDKNLSEIQSISNQKWQDIADEVKGMIVSCPGMKPSSIRVDQLDREHIDSKLDTNYPVIVHFGVRPPQLSYAGNPHYQKAWRDYVKYRHLLANKPKVSYADRHKLLKKELKLQEMRMENDLKRDVTVVISSKGFYKTGMMSDIVQHAMLLPILVCHLRFHDSLSHLEDKIGYKFTDRFLLQLALTHPSYRENFGTNPDHARNSLTNCGLRQPQYGDRRIHYMNTRKRGINTLINIMSRFGSQQEATSSINHNERLEFLGDAVVEFLSSIHLFYLFPDLEEGGLATYRAAIVQNQHLAVLSKKLQLEKFMLYAHGSDLCHDLELRHAMANCFEALMGALFLDGGIERADKVFSKTLFPEQELQEVWKNYPLHPLQEQEPNGDRRWISLVPLLEKLHDFEEQIGIEFTHIRLLARALTHRSLGYNNLTLGSNQRLEFLGDTVLQLVASEYLYKFFPQHHEGHLSLLRSSLVNNRTQAVVCGDLGMTDYAIYPYFKVELKPKDKADLLEAFLGALYVDKDLGYCRKFCEVCFFPRLQHFIMNQDWNDPKSKLQQCCLTLRSMDGGEPDIPTYKVIECKGPTNTRVYAVAVYFQGNRLAVGSGHSIQQAEMDAANNALMKSQDLFPQLKHQKRAIERSLKQGTPRKPKGTPKYAKKN